MYELEILCNISELILCRLTLILKEGDKRRKWRGLEAGLYVKTQDTGYWYSYTPRYAHLRRVKYKNQVENLEQMLLDERKKLVKNAFEQGSGETS